MLAERGVEVLPTETGELACGRRAPGAWPRPSHPARGAPRLRRHAPRVPGRRKVVVTTGGTREAIDAVRFIGNRSSGKMGRAVADEAYLRGAEVTLVTTRRPTACPT